jgi:hypothetical protein
MSQIVEGWGIIGGAPSGGFTKVAIKARLPNSFVGKKTKTKKVQLWLHQVEVYMETQCLKSNKEQIHFTHILLTEHVWD